MAPNLSEKEEALRLKELRREIEAELSERLPERGEKQLHVQVEKLDEALAVDEATAKHVVEALLFSSSKPMTVNEIRRVLKGYAPARIQKMIGELGEEYAKEDRSFRLKEIAGGYEISTEPKYAPWLMKLELQKKARQATQSALETLAILAYKQPVTRAEIEDLRGVNASGMIAALLEKGFIKIVGRKEVPGRPMLYGTTEKFLEHFGLRSLNDMPNISEIKELVENSIRKEELIQPKETVLAQEVEEVSGEGTNDVIRSEAKDLDPNQEQDPSAQTPQNDK